MSARKIRCREIEARDIDAIAGLLTRGFPARSKAYWLQGLHRQAQRAVPDGYPRYGYLLEAAGTVVGTLLLTFSDKVCGGQPAIACNVASWYVEPQFRSQASLLTAMALKHKQVTYVNVTPAPPTWPIIEAQGFKRYCRGLYFSIPAVSRAGTGHSIEPITPGSAKPDDLTQDEFDVLTRHAGYGCLSLICRSPAGSVPFVLAPFRIRQGRIPLPAMQLVYCRDVTDLVSCGGAIGRFLLKRGTLAVILDANAPVAGLVGLYSEARGQKYFRGPNPPRLADLSDTEFVLYGI